MSAPPPTVLHYIGADDDRGGIVSVVRALAGAERFECVLGVNPGFQALRQPALPAVELPRIAGETINLRTLWRSRAVAKAASAWLRAEPGRVFHGHSRAGMLVAGWLVRRGERRVVVSVHCYGRQRWFYRRVARELGERLFWLSPAMKRHYGIAEPETWQQCIPGCVPEAALRPREERGRREGVVRLGGVGALVEWKQWDLVLAALASLPEDVRKKVRFRHIGGVDTSEASVRYAAELRGRTAALGLESVVEWRGPQPSSAESLRETDCLVVASRGEPFSVAMLEALAAGVPVVAADSGGARDIIPSDENGWLFPSGDAGALAQRIEQLVKSGDCFRVRPDAVRLRVFTAPVVAEQWARVYEAVSGRQ